MLSIKRYLLVSSEETILSSGSLSQCLSPYISLENRVLTVEFPGYEPRTFYSYDSKWDDEEMRNDAAYRVAYIIKTGDYWPRLSLWKEVRF